MAFWYNYPVEIYKDMLNCDDEVGENIIINIISMAHLRTASTRNVKEVLIIKVLL